MEGSSISTPSIPTQNVSNMTTPAPGTIENSTKATENSGATAENSAKAAEVKKALKLLKVDGSELQLDEEQYTRFAQKGIGAEKRFAEARALMQQIEAKASELDKRQRELEAKTGQFKGDETDVDVLIKQAQGDPQKLAKVRDRVEKWLLDQIKLESASPEQQELLRTKQELERAREEKKAWLEEKKKQQQEQLTAKHRANIEGTIVKALEISGLPSNEWNVKHMADLMHKAFVGGYELKPEQLAEMVRQDRIANTQSIAKDYTDAITTAHKAGDIQKVLVLGQNLENLMGQQTINALRFYDLAKLKSGQPKVPAKVEATGITKPKEEPKKAYSMSWDQAEAERKKVVAQLDAEWRRR